jgi:hypothetical protein
MTGQDWYATAVFYRSRTPWRDLIRSYRIVVDGVDRAMIRRRKEVSVPVAPGRHIVQARIDWTGSPPMEFDICAGETIRLRVEPAGSAAMSLDQVFGRTSWLLLSVDEPSD